MRRSINTFQAMELKPIGEINGKPSETIPDQAVSAPELLRRFATGQPLGFKNVEAVYDEDPDNPVPEFYKLSKLDRLHFLQENTQRVKDAKQDLQNFLKEQQQQKQQSTPVDTLDTDKQGKTADLNKRSTSSEKQEA